MNSTVKMKRWIAVLVLAGMAGTGFAQGRVSVQMGNLKKVVNEENSVVLITNEAQVRLTTTQYLLN
ncbi:MAG: hypothetical protein WC865_11950 [Bacteroidales bacterium]